MTSKHSKTAAEIGSDAYLESRLNPKPGDTYFLHLKDLRLALTPFQNTDQLAILDFGCGSSPYRSLWPNSQYLRADYVPTDDLDYSIDDDQTVAAPNSSFDLILSTQVLEHVKNPSVYLSECLRMLRPGGRLLLSTHGVFEEHGCPYDFRRWTADGLHAELVDSGFTVSEIKKLTTGPRAVGFLFNLYLGLFAGHRRNTLLGFLYWLLFVKTTKFRRILDKWFDRRSSDCAVVSNKHSPRHSLYIALLAVAKKPEHLP